ncbi:hypothetical protein AWC16_20280 [Mycolicibacter longobardus]|uniref:Uncharacterized protein n=1 Tax=Mycolicibacter longobardus TaxID=1108812 RepID=A0A1X1YAN1_9MYCO|nr:hypothetical protein AWC16_20280 [Mycolicibacter longobardus]
MIWLRCEPGSGGTRIDEVSSGGGRVLLGTTAQCTTDPERIALALQHGFVTRAEREYARLISIEPPSVEPGTEQDWTYWALRFDLTDYLDALAKL